MRYVERGFWPNAFMLLLGLAAVLWPAKYVHGQGAAGYTIEYLDAWPTNDQIKYVRAVVTPLGGTATEDLTFYVVARSVGFQTGVFSSAKISIRRGDSSASGELYVPVCNGYNFSLHAELDGNMKYDIGDFARHSYTNYNYGIATRNSTTPSLVLASSEVVADESLQFSVLTPKGSSKIPRKVPVGTTNKFISLDDLGTWYGPSNVVGGARTIMSINGFSSELVAAMSLESLPSKWFGYEGIGALVISCDDLALLANRHPGKLLAIERWVAASGRLVVLNCGDALERTDEALKYLGDRKKEIREKRKCKTPAGIRINKGVIDEIRDETLEASQQAQMRFPGLVNSGKFSERGSLTDVGLEETTLGDAIASDELGDMIAIEFGAGQVVCLSQRVSDWREERPTDEDIWGEVGVFLQAALRSRQSVHNVLGNDTFPGFGFPEFAEPPRYVFEFSILLYLLAVGPLTFFILKARNKLNLMFIVVPTISFLCCSGILAWAIFAEGFDTRVNVFTFTELNQQTGRQTTSTLSHVYSGMTPSPYRLTGATYGFVNLPSGGRYQRIRWDDQSETISSGEIRARTNHQLMTRCSNETDEKFAFSFKGSGESASASVRNDFATKVSLLVFRSEVCTTNEVWVCREVSPGEIGSAERMTFNDASRLIARGVRERGKKTVLGSDIIFEIERDELPNPNWNPYESSLLAIGELGAASKLNQVWRFNPGILRAMLPSTDSKSFIALTEDCTNHELGIQDAVLETQIHVLRGVR